MIGSCRKEDQMKDHYTLELSGHQANVLNSALQLLRQVVALPSGQPLPLPNQGIGATLVRDEFGLIQEEVAHQFEEQDKK
jgi:hypothetical protein